MALLAQIVDMFSDSTWRLILLIGIGLPCAGFIIGALRRRPASKRRLEWLGAYYIAACASFGVNYLLPHEIPLVAIVSLLIVLCGPLLGLALMAA